MELVEAAKVQEKLGTEIQEKEMMECVESGELLDIAKTKIREHVQENILGINGVLNGVLHGVLIICPTNHWKIPVIFEENRAVIKILQKGRSNALRHANRTHRVSCDWLFMIRKLEQIYVKYIDTKAQAADILTKAFNKAEDFQRLLKITQLTRRPTTTTKTPMPAGGDSVLASQQSTKTRNRPRRNRKRWNRNRDEARQIVDYEGQSTVDVANICVDDYRDDDDHRCYLCTHNIIPTQFAQLAQDGSCDRVDSLPRNA